MSQIMFLLQLLSVIVLLGCHGAGAAKVASNLDDTGKEANIFVDRDNSTRHHSADKLQNIPDLSTILPQQKERIVGGNTVQEGAYPFFAQWMKGCGGSRKFVPNIPALSTSK